LFYKVLEGVKIIEYGNLISTPFIVKILADLRAEVVKIEEPYFCNTSRKMEFIWKNVTCAESNEMGLIF